MKITYIFASHQYFSVLAVASLRWHLQLNGKLILGQDHFWRNLAALQIYTDSWLGVRAGFLATLVQVQMEIAIGEEVSLVALEGELFWPNGIKLCLNQKIR